MPIAQALGALERRGPVEPVARVDDEAGLVRPQVGADARKGAGQRGHGGVLGGLVDEPEAVVAFALDMEKGLRLAPAFNFLLVSSLY